MEDPSHVDILRDGVEAWNEWRGRNPLAIPSLSEAYLEGAYLEEANLSRADLSRANLSEANLHWANHSGADLSGTINLTQDQIDRTYGDEQIKLPEGLKCPLAWSQKSSDEQPKGDA